MPIKPSFVSEIHSFIGVRKKERNNTPAPAERGFVGKLPELDGPNDFTIPLY